MEHELNPCDNCLILPICLSKNQVKNQVCDILYKHIVKQTGILNKDLKPNKKVSFLYGSVYYIIEKVYKIKSFNKSVRVVRYLNKEGRLRVKDIYFVYLYEANHPRYNELEWNGKNIPSKKGDMIDET
jgi:hypothetical protein